MKKKQTTAETELLQGIGAMTFGGVGLGVGGKAVNALPITGATPGINRGFNAMGNFFPVFTNVSAAGYTIKKLREVRKK